VTVYEIPSGEIATALGNSRVQNIVMLGAFLKKAGLVKPEVFLQSLKTIMGERKKAVLEVNRKAFTAGFDFMASHR
jgi:2-oxoglutarate ferredoxin oxidoreductase subunit gamma